MPNLYIVPHTHWDREWYLPFQVFRVKLVHLIDDLLNLLDRDPAFTHFMLDGQTILLEDYLQVRPEREADLIRHVRSGRIAIGPWYVLPDEFLVSPESIVRNLLRGIDVCARFGRRMGIGYIPDPFGHIGQMPQILTGFGLEAACLERGLADEPCELLWQAPDGTRILLLNLRDGYDNAARLPTEPNALAGFLRQRCDSLSPHSIVTPRLLLNGADHQEPQQELPSTLRAASLDPDQAWITSLPDYAEAVQEEVRRRSLSLPVVIGELRSSKRHHVLSGVLSSRSWIKQRNHTCEILLERWAEPFTAWAGIHAGLPEDRSVWTGHLQTPRLSSPQSLLREAWRLLLHCHPHDSICGCSVDAVHEEMRVRFDESEQIGEEITRQSLKALADSVDTESWAPDGARASRVVFNSEGVTRTEAVSAVLELPAGLDPFELVDQVGRPVPCRVVRKDERPLADMDMDRDTLRGILASGRDGWIMGLAVQDAGIVRRSSHVLLDVVLAEEAPPNRSILAGAEQQILRLLDDPSIEAFRVQARFATRAEIELLATEVPPYGYRSYALRPSGEILLPKPPPQSPSIENEFLRVAASPDGSLSVRCLDSALAFEGLLRLSDCADCGDSYNFSALPGDVPLGNPAGDVEIRTTTDPFASSLHLAYSLRLPGSLSEDRSQRSATIVDIPVRLSARLVRGTPRLDVEIRIDNRAQDHRLQALLPLPFPVHMAEYDGHYQIARRETAVDPGGEDWIEEPAPEVPMRNFVAVTREQAGLMVATRGLREARVSPGGIIAVTLLRCFGWLSRSDLRTRKGGAGPMLPTPGGQCPGEHTFHLSLIPITHGLAAAAAQAYAFQTPLRGMAVRPRTGPLPPSGSFLSVKPETFQVTAVKLAESGVGLVVRGVNQSDEVSTVEVTAMQPIRSAHRVRLDESVLAAVPVSDPCRVRFEARGNEVVSLRFLFDGDAPLENA
jgi:alpha-mannosidase